MEMKAVLCREGHEAKTLLDTPAEGAFLDKLSMHPPVPNCRKPPMAPPKSPHSLSPKQAFSPPSRHLAKHGSGPRVRSASTGRDKKSELQARYWALLFGNLQRAVNEIYQTVECYENISSCQEAILVLENYVRDFKALSEWFKVSWDYDARPLQQRQLSLAWEVRKSNPGPRVRAKSLSSPTASGKSSPCPPCPCTYIHSSGSGKTSPCCATIDVLSPRKCCGGAGIGLRAYDPLPKGAMRVNVRELFAAEKRPPVDATDLKTIVMEQELQEPLYERRHQYAQTDLEDDHLTLADIREKIRREAEERQEAAERMEQANCEKAARQAAAEQAAAEQVSAVAIVEQQVSHVTTNLDTTATTLKDYAKSNGNATSESFKEPTALEMTVQTLNAMEDELLAKDANKQPTPPTTELKPIESLAMPKVSTTLTNAEVLKKTDASAAPPHAAGAQNSPLKYSSVLNRAPTSMRSTTKPSTQRMTSSAAANNKPAPAATLPKGANSNAQPLRRSATTASAVGGLKQRFNSGTGRHPNAPHVLPPRPASKTECYGPPTNVATRLSARSRTMIEMHANGEAQSSQSKTTVYQQQQRAPAVARILPPPPSSTASSRKSSREDIGSSSSTLKASNERIATTTRADERHSEPKQLPSDANDGWLTVKNRRRSSMHWASRFNQPTGYASLPTLALLNEKLSEEAQQHKAATATATANDTTKSAKPAKPQKPTEKQTKVALRPEIKNAKAKVNSLPAQRKNSTAPTTQKSSATAAVVISAPLSARSAAVPNRQNNIKRQKSDLTGLKMTSLHKEYMRSEKKKQIHQNGNATSCEEIFKDSSTAAANEANKSNSNSTDSSELLLNAENVEQNKIDIKIQTNREFSKTIGELYESIKAASAFTNGGGSGGSSGGAGTLSSCDENEETLANEIDCDEDQTRMLVEEQESLERQIRELESTEIDVDTETDETDCEVVLEHEREDGDDAYHTSFNDDASSVVFVTGNEGDESNLSLELRYQALLSEISWGEREEALATLQAYVSRHPGRAQELHQKLSSPSRRRSLHETLKKYQAKQARAQQKRELLQKEKAIKIQQLLARVEDVKAAKQQLIEDKRLKMEGRLQRAAENREQYLRQIIEKAHDEEKKLKEINFIKNIEAQNKRLDLIESSKETEGRLQDLEQERQKRLEEKAAKEAAVERRRQELEKERQRKLEKMNETRLEKEQRIGKMQEQKERQRQALAREKARDREERLLALQVAQQQTTEELQRKILQKQKESARRHEENIEHIRQRALELTIPLRNVDENGLPRAENGEEGGIGEDGDLSSTVSDVGSREHTRGYKKKMKKLKQRLSLGAEEYMKELQPVPLHMKRESQVPKFLNLVTKGGGAQGIERPLGQLLRLMAKAQVFDFQCFLLMDGIGIITTHVITKGMQEDSEVSKKAVVLAVQLYRNACTLCPQIARHAILGNTITSLFDALFQSLQLPEEKSPQHPVELSTELMLACTVALSPSYTKKQTHPKVLERLPDLISYAVITGLVEILSRRCMKIRESIENHQSVVLSLLATLGFLTRFVDVCPAGPTDTTRFLTAAKSTELFGSISMLYASVVPMGECIPPRTISLAAATFNLLVSMAVLDLATFQDIMSAEALALKFLDVVTILLKYCGNKVTAAKNSETQAVVIDLIATIGFLCANNKKNQDLLTSEQCSIIIKSLTKLPEHLNVVVYPCLVTITFQNEAARNVIARDFNLDFLDEYSKSEKAKKNHLVALLKEKT